MSSSMRNPNNPEKGSYNARLAPIYALIRAMKNDAAITKIRNILQKDNLNHHLPVTFQVECLTMLAKAYLQKNNFSAAKEALIQAENLITNKFDGYRVYIEFASYYIQTHDCIAAQNALNKIDSFFSNHTYFTQLTNQLSVKTHKIPPTNFLNDDSEDPINFGIFKTALHVLIDRSRACEANGKDEEEIKQLQDDFQKLVTLYSDLPMAHLAEARMLSDLVSKDAGIAKLKWIVKEYPTYLEGRLSYGVMLSKAHELKSATTTLEEVFQDALKQMAITGLDQDAKRVLCRLIGQAATSLSIVYQEQNQFTLAKDYSKLALKYDPNNDSAKSVKAKKFVGKKRDDIYQEARDINRYRSNRLHPDRSQDIKKGVVYTLDTTAHSVPTYSAANNTTNEVSLHKYNYATQLKLAGAQTKLEPSIPASNVCVYREALLKGAAHVSVSVLATSVPVQNTVIPEPKKTTPTVKSYLAAANTNPNEKFKAKKSGSDFFKLPYDSVAVKRNLIAAFQEEIDKGCISTMSTQKGMG